MLWNLQWRLEVNQVAIGLLFHYSYVSQVFHIFNVEKRKFVSNLSINSFS